MSNNFGFPILPGQDKVEDRMAIVVEQKPRERIDDASNDGEEIAKLPPNEVMPKSFEVFKSKFWDYIPWIVTSGEYILWGFIMGWILFSFIFNIK